MISPTVIIDHTITPVTIAVINVIITASLTVHDAVYAAVPGLPLLPPCLFPLSLVSLLSTQPVKADGRPP